MSQNVRTAFESAKAQHDKEQQTAKKTKKQINKERANKGEIQQKIKEVLVLHEESKPKFHWHYLIVLLPPIAILIKKGFGFSFFLNIFLTLCGGAPGFIHAYFTYIPSEDWIFSDSSSDDDSIIDVFFD